MQRHRSHFARLLPRRLDNGGPAGHGRHESDASLLVMGGYGHWRAWEVLFGGCTQAALEIGELPVFVVH